MNDEAKPTYLFTMTNVENFELLLLVLPLLNFSLSDKNIAKHCLSNYQCRELSKVENCYNSYKFNHDLREKWRKYISYVENKEMVVFL